MRTGLLDSIKRCAEKYLPEGLLPPPNAANGNANIVLRNFRLNHRLLEDTALRKQRIAKQIIPLSITPNILIKNSPSESSPPATQDDSKVFVAFYQLPGAKYQHWALKIEVWRTKTIFELKNGQRNVLRTNPEDDPTFQGRVFIAHIHPEKDNILEACAEMVSVDEMGDWALQDYARRILGELDDEYAFLESGGFPEFDIHSRVSYAFGAIYLRYHTRSTTTPNIYLSTGLRQLNLAYDYFGHEAPRQATGDVSFL
ncbi:hypothetical protein BJX64DRAFT_285299 [Aspergillus heterothallicus]